MEKYNQLEMAKIFGEPIDPRKPYPDIVTECCETDVAEADEYHYYFDTLLESDTIHTITNTGAVTQVNVLPDTPAALTFVDAASPEYYVKLTDLASAKERTLARKLKTIDRALNAYETFQVIECMEAACTSSGNYIDRSASSGATTFNYAHLITMIDGVIDYGSNYSLVAGTLIDKDIKLWDWNDNKYTSLAAALQALGINIIRSNALVTIDASATRALEGAKAYLVAKDSEVGKPNLFVRKKINDIDLLGGAIKQSGDKPQRIVFVSPNPITVTSSARYLAVGITGFEEIVVANTNPHACFRFERIN
ncbi:MAG: hypothetical protein M0R23_08845 [Bacteroidales bacterium]|jgi:hypothetical protein|nr:hypothetical protein [Bacteroidales bacterium]